ncbi:MAG: hypothetical protein K2O66_04535 [Bacteroidales bacterium]|nr:hypothetical protein [Bacteroidales bacterium]MDE7072610.1 hypothetical protein [Bacteroidales bacterium]
MQRAFWKNLIRFLFLVLLQGMVLEHIELPGHLHLMVVPVFILLLPLQLPAVPLLILGFLSGFCVDLLCQIPGLNAAAATFMAFSRIVYFRIKNRRDAVRDADIAGTPLPSGMGWGGFIEYTLWMVVLFHLAYFLLDAFSLRHVFYTLYLLAGSSLLCFLSVLFTVSVFRARTNTR